MGIIWTVKEESQSTYLDFLKLFLFVKRNFNMIIIPFGEAADNAQRDTGVKIGRKADNCWDLVWESSIYDELCQVIFVYHYIMKCKYQ